MRSTNVATRPVFANGYSQNGFSSSSWNAWVQPQGQAQKGLSGNPAFCANLNQGGGVAFKGWNGVFQNQLAVEVSPKLSCCAFAWPALRQ